MGADGQTLAATANGAFTTPIVLANELAATNNTYRLTLTGSSGISLSAGESLTFRIYFSCGSSSAGRYGKIKNVIVKGVANASLPAAIVTNFVAFKQNNQIALSWNCINNQTLALFNVEKSLDGNNFKNIATMLPNVNSTYQFIDATTLQQTTYYRLKIIDKNFTNNYSNIIAIKNSNLNAVLYPNPTANKIEVLYNQLKEDATFHIVTYKNQILLTSKIYKGTTHSYFDVSTLQSGIYFIWIYNNDIRQTIPFVKK